MSTASADFLAEIRASAIKLDLTPKTLCQKAVRNQRLVSRLESGGSVTVETVERFRAFVAAEERARAALTKATAA